jgi:hypothetical protein
MLATITVWATCSVATTPASTWITASTLMGALTPGAQAYLDRLKSYAEYSPSHTGIHILVYGTIKSDIRRRVPDTPQPEKEHVV